MEIREIIGNTTATPNPRPDWAQTDETKADFIKNKPEILTEDDVAQLIVENIPKDESHNIISTNEFDESKLPSMTIALGDSYEAKNLVYTRNGEPNYYISNNWEAEGLHLTANIPANTTYSVFVQYHDAMDDVYLNELPDIVSTTLDKEIKYANSNNEVILVSTSIAAMHGSMSGDATAYLTTYEYENGSPLEEAESLILHEIVNLPNVYYKAIEPEWINALILKDESTPYEVTDVQYATEDTEVTIGFDGPEGVYKTTTIPAGSYYQATYSGCCEYAWDPENHHPEEDYDNTTPLQRWTSGRPNSVMMDNHGKIINVDTNTHYCVDICAATYLHITTFRYEDGSPVTAPLTLYPTNEITCYDFENLQFTTEATGNALLGDVYSYLDTWGNRKYTLNSSYTPNIAEGQSAVSLAVSDPENMLYSIKLEALFNGGHKYSLGNKDFSFLGGCDVVANGNGTLAAGKETFVTGANANGFGMKNFVRGNTAAALGYNNIVTGLHSFATNEGNKALGYASFVWGDHNTVLGAHSFGGGWNNKTKGQYSVVSGSENTIDGEYNVGFGHKSSYIGQYNIGNGLSSKINGIYNTTNGYNNKVTGDNNIVNGMNNTVPASFSTVNGFRNTITEGKQNGHIINGTTNTITTKTSQKNIINGENNNITYVGDIDKPDISGSGYSIVSGINNVIKSRFGSAIGEGLDVQGHYGTQLVLGKYNKMDKWAHFIVGNGKSDTQRNNIFTIKQDGRAILGADPKDKMDATTKQYVDSGLESKLDKSSPYFNEATSTNVLDNSKLPTDVYYKIIDPRVASTSMSFNKLDAYEVTSVEKAEEDLVFTHQFSDSRTITVDKGSYYLYSTFESSYRLGENSQVPILDPLQDYTLTEKRMLDENDKVIYVYTHAENLGDVSGDTVTEIKMCVTTFRYEDGSPVTSPLTLHYLESYDIPTINYTDVEEQKYVGQYYDGVGEGWIYAVIPAKTYYLTRFDWISDVPEEFPHDITSTQLQYDTLNNKTCMIDSNNKRIYVRTELTQAYDMGPTGISGLGKLYVTTVAYEDGSPVVGPLTLYTITDETRYDFENIQFTTESVGNIKLNDVFTYKDEWGNTCYTLYPDYTPNIKPDTAVKNLKEYDPEDMLHSIKLEALHNGGYKYSLGNKEFSYLGGTDIIADGNGALASGIDSYAIGNSANALGRLNKVRAQTGIALGYNNIVTGRHGVALNEGNKVLGYAALGAGDHNTVGGAYDIVSGWQNTSRGTANIVQGSKNTVNAELTICQGSNNTVEGNTLANFGNRNVVKGGFSIVQGYKNNTDGQYISVTGNNNTVSGVSNTVTGGSNVVTGEGYNGIVGATNTINGSENFIAGYKNKVNAVRTLVSGANNTVETGSNYSLVVGMSNVTKSRFANAIGAGLTASGDYSQLVVGRYNVVESDAHFIVGNGVNTDSKSNAFVVHYDGRAMLGADPVDKMDAVTKQYLDSKIGEIESALLSIIEEQEAIIAQQKAIIEAQSSLIGGNN